MVSLFSLRFMPLSFRIYFLGLLKSTLSCRYGGAKLLGEGYPGWASARDVAEDHLYFLFFLLLQFATES